MLKHTGKTLAERQSVINECSLIKALNSEYLVQVEDVFEYENRVYIFLEMTEGGDLSNIVIKSPHVYSELFVKYTLYNVAMGI